MPITSRTMATLLERLYAGWTGAKERHLGRFKTGLSKLQEVAGLYGPGYMAGQERLALTGAKSALAARGLGGTTRPQAVSAGMKAGFEDVRRAGRAGAMTNIADYMAGFKELEADPGTLAYLATGGFGAGMQERGMEMTERAEAEARKGPSPWEPGFMGGGWTIGGAGDVGGTARMPSMPSMPGSPYGEITGRTGGLSPAADIFQKPLTTATPTAPTGTMAGVTVGQVGGGMSDAELAKKFGIDIKRLDSNVNVGDRQMTMREYLLGGASHAAFGVGGSTGSTSTGQRGYPAAM